jgi:hypothetical protein
LVVVLDLGEDFGVLRLALSNTEDRDAWFRWFSELVVQRELNAIESAALEERRGIFDNEASHSVKIDAVASTAAGKQAVNEYTQKFLQKAGRSSRADEVPAKGRLQIQPPEFRSFTPCQIVGSLRTGIVSIQQLSSTLFTKKVPGTLELTAECRIIAPMPWKPEFAVFLNDFVGWQFRTKSVEQRNSFIAYFRLVKGRGRLAQTEQETFPYLTAAEIAAAEAEEATGRALRDAKKHMHGSFIIVNHDDDDDDEADDFSDSSEDSRAGTKSPSSPTSRLPEPEPESLTFERALVDYPHLLWTTVDDPDSDASDENDRPRSVRPFRPFAGHFDSVLLSYVDEACQPHIIGRRNFRLSTHPKSSLAKQLAQRKEASANLGGRTNTASPVRRPRAMSPASMDRKRSSPPRPVAAGTPSRFQSTSAAMAAPASARRPTRTTTPVRAQVTSHSHRRASEKYLDPDTKTSAVDASRSLRLGLQRLNIKPEDKERLRPRPAQQPASSYELREQRTRTPVTVARHGLKDLDGVRVPRTLFSNVAPHIALSAHIGPSTRRTTVQ